MYLVWIFYGREILSFCRRQDPIEVMNTYLNFLFSHGVHVIAIFLQTLPVIELESLLHLSRLKSRIISSYWFDLLFSDDDNSNFMFFYGFFPELFNHHMAHQDAVFGIGSITMTSWNTALVYASWF